MAIATASEYKTYAGISGTTYDARLAVILPGVQKEMERVCNRQFDYDEAIGELVDGCDTDKIVLHNAPISSITSLRALASDGSILIDYSADSYDYDEHSGVVTLANGRDGWLANEGEGLPVWSRQVVSPGFPRGFRNIQIVYGGGYGDSPAHETMPDDLKMLFYDLISIRLAQGAKDPTLRSESLGSYSYTNGDITVGTGGWQKLLAEKCAPWKRLGVLA